MRLELGVMLWVWTAVVLCATPAAALVIPPASGSTFNLPTGSAHSLFLPAGLDLAGGIDVLVHFHGDPGTVRDNAAFAGLDAAVITVNYGGLSSSYAGPFASDPGLFGDLLDGALATVRSLSRTTAQASWDRLAVSSFSAGYAAVREILKQPASYGMIDAMLLADSLHAGFEPGGGRAPRASQMADFRRFAADAAAGNKTMLVTHSQVATTTFASTTETADDLLNHIDLVPTRVRSGGLGPLRFYRRAEAEGFRLWGATGSDAEAHLSHLRYIAQWMDGLFPAPVGDLNGDGFVGAGDLDVLLGQWNASAGPGSAADLSGDGFIGAADLDILLGAWNRGEPLPASASLIPEPGTLGALTAGACAVSVRRRRR